MFSGERKMAHSFHSSTLSLTLPISCQICLGKVRKPVICPNHHVFCSTCMETWLKNASVCPTCRIPITAENPCKEIIGGSNDNKYSENPSMRKYLRKTRGDLLLREYEDEIEELMSENEQLKTQNQSLEAQLKTALNPCSSNPAQPEDNSPPPSALQDLRNNVQTATEACAKFKHEVDRLKEASKVLRCQNIDLVQENMRLKAEVQSRSPQKFGRLTVAVMETRIQQYERDMNQLRKALERSDQYIDELEGRLRKSEKGGLEVKEACGKSKAGTETLTRQQKFNMMMRSLSDNEREMICSNPEAGCSSVSRNLNLALRPSADARDIRMEDQNMEDSDSSSCDFLPNTPSTVFRNLTLKSPGAREKKGASKPLPHQRRLDFNFTPEKEPKVVGLRIPYRYSPTFGRGPLLDFMELSKSSFWSSLQKPDFDMQCPGPSKQSTLTRSTSSTVEEEAAMNAAFEDKVSELDSMMLEGESSVSRGSRPSTASSCGAFILAPEAPPDPYRSDIWEPLKFFKPRHLQQSGVNATLNVKEAEKRAEGGFTTPESGKKDGAEVPGGSERAGPSQSEEMPFDLPFESTDEVKAGPSGSLSSASQHQDHVTPPSSSCTAGTPVNTRERPAMSSSQTAKRKSHSPFSTHSPTKHSKLK